MIQAHEGYAIHLPIRAAGKVRSVSRITHRQEEKTKTRGKNCQHRRRTRSSVETE